MAATPRKVGLGSKPMGGIVRQRLEKNKYGKYRAMARDTNPKQESTGRSKKTSARLVSAATRGNAASARSRAAKAKMGAEGPKSRMSRKKK